MMETSVVKIPPRIFRCCGSGRTDTDEDDNRNDDGDNAIKMDTQLTVLVPVKVATVLKVTTFAVWAVWLVSVLAACCLSYL